MEKQQEEEMLEWEMGDILVSKVTGNILIPYEYSTVLSIPLDAQLGDGEEVPSVLMYGPNDNRTYNMRRGILTKKYFKNLMSDKHPPQIIMEQLYITTEEGKWQLQNRLVIDTKNLSTWNHKWEP